MMGFSDDAIVRHDHPQNIYSCRCMNPDECSFCQRMERENIEWAENCPTCKGDQ